MKTTLNHYRGLLGYILLFWCVNWALNIAVNVPVNILKIGFDFSVPRSFALGCKTIAVIIAAYLVAKQFCIIENRTPSKRERDIVMLSAGTLNAVFVIIFGLLSLFALINKPNFDVESIKPLAAGYIGIIAAGYAALYLFFGQFTPSVKFNTADLV